MSNGGSQIPDDPDATVVIRAPRRPGTAAAPPPAAAPAAAPDPAPASDPPASEAPALVAEPRRAAGTGPTAPGVPSAPPPLTRFETDGNPLLQVSGPILELAVRLGGLQSHPDVPALHARVREDFARFEERARSAGVVPDHIAKARYALCALIDDVVLNTGWGSESVWSVRSMVGQFHRETVGGERFFEQLRELEAAPQANLDLLELMYLCLSLGFQGQLRRPPDGPAEHTRVRERIYALIARYRGPVPAALSPQWRGVSVPLHRPSRLLPLWLIGAIAVLLLLLLFVGLRFLLADTTDRLRADLAALPLDRPVEIQHVAPPDPPAIPPPPPAEPTTTLFDRLSTRLATDIAAGRVALTETDDAVRVTMQTAGLFDSASATIDPAERPLIERVADALGPESALILVVGHTDSLPIRGGPFADNLALSLARAETVKSLLIDEIGQADRIAAEGRGASRPVATNATAEGRAQNRRIDIVVLKSG